MGSPRSQMMTSIMRMHKIVGIVGVATAYLFIAVSIVLSPWFNFYNNALSDLGNNALHGSTAWFYNLGLILSGFLIASSTISISLTHRSWKYLIWAVPLAAAGLDLALIGFFPEDAGQIHLLVSLIFFASIVLTMLIYSYVSWPLGTPAIGGMALIFGIASVVVWFVKWPWRGVAIRETVTSTLAAIWLISVYLKNT